MSSSRLKGFFEPKPRFSNKLPAIYLDSTCRSENPHHLEVFFVNASDQPLDFVASPQPLLFLSSLAESSVQNDTLYYDDIAPGEAVKVAEFDEVFDSDFLHQLTLIWQGPVGDAQHVTIIEKGTRKFTYRVLQWRED